MTSQEKIVLLQKYLKGQCSEAEKQQVAEFLQKADEDIEVNQLLDKAWQNLNVYPALSERTSEKMFQVIASQVELQNKHVPTSIHQRRSFLKRWSIAAAVALLLLFAGIIYFLYTPEEYLQTGFGQTATITLPDQSVVMLNGNSSIRYKKKWDQDAIREVWLDGEGYFQVVHQANHQKFIVHTKDQIDVEVLGTTFTFARRKAGTRVVLNEGKVRLNLTNTALSVPVNLLPGDLVEVKSTAGKVEKRKVNPETYSSWTKQVLSFNNTPLSEVVAWLEETYGVEITVLDKALYSRKVSGSTPITKDLDLFFIGLEQTFDLTIERKGNKVLLKNLP